MKTALKTASILSWFNIIFWGLIDGLLLLSGLLSFSMPILAVAVLLSAVPLNCYASLKLHASIRIPNLLLSHQTPVGIRFVGFIALFFGTGWISEGIMLLKNGTETQEALNEQIAQVSKTMQQLPQFSSFKQVNESNIAHAFGIMSLVLGVFVVVNVVLNLRLLRWYYLVRKSGVS